MPEGGLLEILRGGGGNALGRAVEAADMVLERPELFMELFGGLGHELSGVRMRAAYAFARVVKARPDWLVPLMEPFLDRLAAADNSHLARACMLNALGEVLPEVEEGGPVADMLLDFMHSESSIVKTFSLELLVRLAQRDDALMRKVLPLFCEALERGTPAMRARARKLMRGNAV